MDPRKPQQIQQIEVIEHFVEEGRRPVGGAAPEALSYRPQPYIPYADQQDQRFRLTSERDVGRDASFLSYPAQTSFLPPREPPLLQSTPERNHSYSESSIQNFSLIPSKNVVPIVDPSSSFEPIDQSPVVSVHQRQQQESFVRSTVTTTTKGPVGFSGVAPVGPQPVSTVAQPDQLHGILRNADSWRRIPSAEESSLSRKESYRRMQDQQERDASVYAPSSNASLVSKRSSQKAKKEISFMNGTFSDKVANVFNESVQQIRDGEWTPRLIAILCVLLLVLALLMFLLWSLFSWLFLTKSTYTFYLYPPVCEECARKNPSLLTNRPPSKLYARLYSPAQAHFELVGSTPFKSNSFTAVDFETGYIAVADHALTNERGRHFACFIMDLDRTALPNMKTLIYALKHTPNEVYSQFGWQEYWQYTVEQVDASFISGKFRDEPKDCQGVKWYYLKHSIYTRDSSCSDCYDFCLPDYAVLRLQKYEDDVSIGFRRLNCFRLYVPEWHRFSVETDASGGHWRYPQHQPQFTQRDEDGNWVNWFTGSSMALYGGQEQNQQRRRETFEFRQNPQFINLSVKNRTL